MSSKSNEKLDIPFGPGAAVKRSTAVSCQGSFSARRLLSVTPVGGSGDVRASIRKVETAKRSRRVDWENILC